MTVPHTSQSITNHPIRWLLGLQIVHQNWNRDFLLKIESKSIVWLKSHIVTALIAMVSGAGWILGHPGDAKILLLHHVPSMSHWTRWVYERLLSYSTLNWYCCLGLFTFETVSQSQITYTVLVETLNPAHFLTYERPKCLAVKGVDRRLQRRHSPRNAKTARGNKKKKGREREGEQKGGEG